MLTVMLMALRRTSSSARSSHFRTASWLGFIWMIRDSCSTCAHTDSATQGVCESCLYSLE